jgi:hypothetical protein
MVGDCLCGLRRGWSGTNELSLCEDGEEDRERQTK